MRSQTLDLRSQPVVNLVTNPIPVGMGTWGLGSQPTVATFSDGAPCVQTVAVNASTPYVFSSIAQGVIVAGQTYTLSADVEVVGDDVGARYHVRAHERGGNIYYQQGALLNQVITAKQRVAVVFVAPAGILDSNFDLSFVRYSGGAPAGTTLRMGRAFICSGVYPALYGDGSRSGWRWLGSPDASQSAGYAPPPPTI